MAGMHFAKRGMAEEGASDSFSSGSSAPQQNRVAHALDTLGFESGHGRGYYVDGALFLLMMIAVSVKGSTMFVFGGMEFTFTHAAVGVLGAYIFVRCLMVGRGFRLPTAPVNILLATFAIITLIDTPRYGFGSLLLKYVFQYLVILVMVNFYALLGARRSIRLVKAGAWLVLALIVINAAIHYQAFAAYYARPWDGHPNYPTVFAGGVNLEATWPAMFSAFFDNDRQGRIYLVLVLLLAVVVTSRAGLLLVAAAAFYVLFLKDRKLDRRVLIALAVCALVFVLVIALGIALGIPMFDRMTSIGEDGGSRGRLSIWRNAVKVVEMAPVFGVGAGNVMDWVRAFAQYPFQEDNVHMYALQILTDFGFVGFAVFAVCVLRFIIQNVRERFHSPFSAFILLYLLISFIQFRGGELPLGFVLAGACAFGAALGGDSGSRVESKAHLDAALPKHMRESGDVSQ